MLGVSNVERLTSKMLQKFPSGYFDGINGSSARQIEVPVKSSLSGVGLFYLTR